MIRGCFMEDVESLDGQLAETQEPEVLSFDVLTRDPTLYRARLKVVVDGLPLDHEHSVLDFFGDKNAELVRFCLNPDNLDSINSAIQRVITKREPLSEDTKRILGDIDEGEAHSAYYRDKSEIILRKRLLAWMDFLDEVSEQESDEKEVSPVVDQEDEHDPSG